MATLRLKAASLTTTMAGGNVRVKRSSALFGARLRGLGARRVDRLNQQATATPMTLSSAFA
jgi:hypothetical protein